jgi:acetylornithine deacetylase/succinyl-diaminopimelate desuccinylase-like protein
MTNSQDLLSSVETYWEKHIVPTLSKYIEIPAKSPAFDPDWMRTGHLAKVLELVENWIDERAVPGMKKEVLRIDGRTPLLVLDLPGDYDYEVLMYGHLDKQPEMTGWNEGLGPWKAVRQGDKLYGRGGADDGYAVFACVCALEHLLQTKVARPHIKVAIEFSEESGSPDLPPYFEKFADKFGSPDLIVCLDSGAGNYEQFWTTTSLRGLAGGTLTVEILKEGVHSGDASGIVPSSFRIARQILNRIEDVNTGEIHPKEFQVEIPDERKNQIQKAAAILGKNVHEKFPFVEGAVPAGLDAEQLIANRTWKAALSVTGAAGLPELTQAGNVLRPFTSLQLSLRLPPTLDGEKAAAHLKKTLETEPPYHAKVTFEGEEAATGWNAPEMQPALTALIDEASKLFYGKEALAMGEGGTIPFMGMLGRKFPKAQFVITGVLGPASNAHGPNEFIHLGYAKKLNACVIHLLASAERLK